MQVERTLFPACNSRSSEVWHDDGSKGQKVQLWCSPESGGHKREWIGHPRKVDVFRLKKFERRAATSGSSPTGGVLSDLSAVWKSYGSLGERERSAEVVKDTGEDLLELVTSKCACVPQLLHSLQLRAGARWRAGDDLDDAMRAQDAKYK